MQKKSNIIQFPDPMSENMTERVLERKNLQEDSIELARFAMHIIQETIEQQDWSPLSDNMDIQNPDSDTYKDLYVILNMLVATFMRSAEIDHVLQDDLATVYGKLKVLEYADQKNIDLSDIFNEPEDDPNDFA